MRRRHMRRVVVLCSSSHSTCLCYLTFTSNFIWFNLYCKQEQHGGQGFDIGDNGEKTSAYIR